MLKLGSTNLQQAVPSCIQGAFELQHVPILLWVYVLIGKVHLKTLQDELHPAVLMLHHCPLG